MPKPAVSAARARPALGFDGADAEQLEIFTRAIVAAGADRLIVHARKAVLGGLSPHENRTVPPLRVEVVAALRAGYPRMPLVINGGFRSREAVLQAMQQFDGVMIAARPTIGRSCWPSCMQHCSRPRHLHRGSRPCWKQCVNTSSGKPGRALR